MDGSAPSDRLLAANQRLIARRAATQSNTVSARSTSGKGVFSAETQLPNHIGWVSRAVTPQQDAPNRPQPSPHIPQIEVIASATSIDASSERQFDLTFDHCKLHPDLGLAMLRSETTAAGRIWLLLRQVDQTGRGWVTIEEARKWITETTSPLRCCGWRQLRNLLRAGQGIYWERDKTRVWLKSVAKVAIALDVQRLTGQPIALAAKQVAGKLGDFRAHLYTAFHSGRRGAPIARATLVQLSHVSPSSQRNYERRLGLDVRFNYAIGASASSAEQQRESAWQHGAGTFIWQDFQGQYGERGAKYMARQLPNSYASVHAVRPKGQQKRINRQLKDLLTSKGTGNVEQQSIEKRYFETCPNSAETARLTYIKNTTQSRKAQLWFVLGGE